jgi:hypothetical protein
MALIRALMAHDDPQTYEQIFVNIDDDEVVIVSGEHDNEFVPGGGGTPVDGWSGLDEEGSVQRGEEHRFETPVLPAGNYKFAITGDADADLYVRLGNAPNEDVFDCRPFRTGSNEECVVTVPAPAPAHIMVRGWDPLSEYQLVGQKL